MLNTRNIQIECHQFVPPWPTVVPRDRPETGATLGWLVNDKLSTKAVEFVVCRFADDFFVQLHCFLKLGVKQIFEAHGRSERLHASQNNCYLARFVENRSSLFLVYF